MRLLAGNDHVILKVSETTQKVTDDNTEDLVD